MRPARHGRGCPRAGGGRDLAFRPGTACEGEAGGVGQGQGRQPAA